MKMSTWDIFEQIQRISIIEIRSIVEHIAALILNKKT